MQLEPRNSSFATPARRAASITFAAIARLSYKNSPGRVALARMPPTRAAASTTASGRAASSHASTAACRRRSSSPRPAVSTAQPAPSSRRATAAPTMPRWPATQTRLPASGNTTSAVPVIAPGLARHRLEVGPHHLGDQLRKPDPRRPAERRPRLARVAEQQVDLGRPEVAQVDRDQRLAGRRVEPDLVDPRPPPDDPPADHREGGLDELAHRARLAGRQHVVVRGVLLEDPPHPLGVVARVPPVAPGVEVAQVEPALQPVVDRRHRPGDLAGDEGLAAHRALVVEQDAVRG